MELERIGLIPRSMIRIMDRFYQQLSGSTGDPLVKQFRFSKYLLLTTLKSLWILILVPLFINFLSKNYLFRPLTEYFWNQKQAEIFLNFELQERAFEEIRDFEEKMYFESLVQPLALGEENQSSEIHSIMPGYASLPENPLKVEMVTNLYSFKGMGFKEDDGAKRNLTTFPNSSNSLLKEGGYAGGRVLSVGLDGLTQKSSPLLKDFRMDHIAEQNLEQKMTELAKHYNQQSIEAITNLLADLMGLATLGFLFVNMKMSIVNTTAFLFESFFSLNDSKKSFLMLLFTDLLVGFHSPRGWEVIFQFIFAHFGLPENENVIFLLVGTFPVLLDVLFKYWIFRHLNRHSPATVATYQSMVE
uniref:Chloroplast envelope membrane protein n=1 Tax=Oedocladium carolinianum TaxID=55992 RepID=A0A1D8GXB7_9CHLO|nr:chloroplast enveloppe membrane protein [Oedocladium carolinianum]YP_009310794.1 chloroplast enveloppe membrane protein [Oedocladium carolinianum]AOT84284.1 chloroplast enveloppe membrane protein [Oedocladium carolinianum]AOT84351.1 chloroplast enveloppe membrane protein [Oedocladium carolinianum]UCS09772.1 chloroplast envelope membrane protein [Oedocladium carolinianum]UCS09801.1 chloroplast envelope membrane protein [Oedocladium carolinianum]